MDDIDGNIYADYLGKTIFMLYPDNKMQEIIISLFKSDYEIYSIYNEKKLIKLLEIYNKAIVIINADKDIDVVKLDNLISGISGNDKTKNTIIYIIHENHNPVVNDLKTTGIKSIIRKDYDDLFNLIKSVLDDSRAIGRRKHLRLNCENDNIKFNAKIGKIEYNGKISNISSAAILCNFGDHRLNLTNDMEINNIVINLKDRKIRVNGKVFKSVEGYNENLYVILLNMNNENSESVEVIKNFIFKMFQDLMKKKIKEMKII